MVFLIFLSILGLAASVGIHALVLLRHFYPPELLIRTLNWGLILLLCTKIIVTDIVSRKFPKDKFRKRVFSCCPRHLKIFAGVVISYGLVMSLVSLIAYYSEVMTTGNMEITQIKFSIGLSALWVAIYMFETSSLYCYRKLWKTKLHDDLLNLKTENEATYR